MNKINNVIESNLKLNSLVRVSSTKLDRIQKEYKESLVKIFREINGIINKLSQVDNLLSKHGRINNPIIPYTTSSLVFTVDTEYDYTYEFSKGVFIIKKNIGKWEMWVIISSNGTHVTLSNNTSGVESSLEIIDSNKRVIVKNPYSNCLFFDDGKYNLTLSMQDISSIIEINNDIETELFYLNNNFDDVFSEGLEKWFENVKEFIRKKQNPYSREYGRPYSFMDEEYGWYSK